MKNNPPIHRWAKIETYMQSVKRTAEDKRSKCLFSRPLQGLCGVTQVLGYFLSVRFADEEHF